jgi:hypothetical protein
MKPILAMIPLIALLSACDAPSNEPAANPILDPQVRALEKAKGVEGQLKNAAEAQRQQLEKDEQ